MAQWSHPYARAAFEYAENKQQVPHWSTMLHWLSELVQNQTIKNLLKNPQYDAMVLADIFCQLGKDVLDAAACNFVKLLAEKHRLAWLEEISQLFIEYQRELENKLTASVISAIALTDAQRKTLMTRLTERFNKQIELEEKIDQSIVGGMIICIGDKVIDCSTRGQLSRLKHQLMEV